jgi:glucosamine--fructose-6-phosphate aminotransferase (isomerizing)
MCGIVGGLLEKGSVTESLLEGLRVLEYRGYDSAGIAVLGGEGIAIRRKEGRIERLAAALADGALSGGRAGIGHTRWATHGPPTDANAHPHTDAKGRVAIVHNGIFENYLELRRELGRAGVKFTSDTDTEVLAHLVGLEMEAGTPFAEAVRKSLLRVRGYYAVAALSVQDGEPRLVCARAGPPLMVATTADSAWLASDVLALIPHARDVIALEDGDVAELSIGRVRVVRLDGAPVDRPARRIEWDPETAAKGTFPHFMLKEIHEQADVLARTAFDRLREEKGDVAFESGGWGDERLRRVERISIVACGTALHAALVARYLIEGLSGIPVDVDYASEFRYRDPLLAKGTLALAISQSGETADTLAALRRARELGAQTASICNVEGSTLVRESQSVILTRAGPEIGVASTKAFVAQLVAAYLLALRLGRARGTIGVDVGRVMLEELRLLRPRMEQMLGERTVSAVQGIAERHLKAKGFLFLGRGINFPIALEGALKIKEIAYVHAEGYAAGEMKHGPIALIEPAMSIVAVVPRGRLAEKMRSNIEQVRARGGQVICVGSDTESFQLAQETAEVPECSEWLSPILNVIPLQLLAYHVANLRGSTSTSRGIWRRA